jgi:hypothetical protein
MSPHADWVLSFSWVRFRARPDTEDIRRAYIREVAGSSTADELAKLVGAERKGRYFRQGAFPSNP